MPAPLPTASAAERVPVQLTLPPDSDLVMVETHASMPRAEIEEPEVPRTRRVRPTRTVTADEPLQMVETRKDQAGP